MASGRNRWPGATRWSGSWKAELIHQPPLLVRRRTSIDPVAARPRLPWIKPMPEPLRTVNVHEAKTHFSRLIDAAHAGETIVVAKGGRPWARLVPLEPPIPRRQPGVLAGRISLPPIEELLEPLPAEELAGLEQPLP